MIKTIVFKKEFEDKLKELKIKTKFVKNVKDYCKRNYYDLQYHLHDLNEKVHWRSFVDFAFTWSRTPEGHNYWSGITKNQLTFYYLI